MFSEVKMSTFSNNISWNPFMVLNLFGLFKLRKRIVFTSIQIFNCFISVIFNVHLMKTTLFLLYNSNLSKYIDIIYINRFRYKLQIDPFCIIDKISPIIFIIAARILNTFKAVAAFVLRSYFASKSEPASSLISVLL